MSAWLMLRSTTDDFDLHMTISNKTHNPGAIWRLNFTLALQVHNKSYPAVDACYVQFY